MTATTLTAAGPLLYASSGGNATGWNLLMVALAVVSLARILRRPSASWRHGGWEKAAWLFVCLVANFNIGHYLLTIGGPAAMWRMRRLPKPPQQGDIPFAAGRPLPDDEQ